MAAELQVNGRRMGAELQADDSGQTSSTIPDRFQQVLQVRFPGHL